MFGFIGQYTAKLDYTQYGARIGSGSGHKFMDFHLVLNKGFIGGKAEFDVNNESGTLPITQNINGEITIPFDENNRFLYFDNNNGDVTLDQQSGLNSISTRLYRVGVLSRGIGWEFNLSDFSSLTPPSRRNILSIVTPNNVKAIGFGNTANIYSATHNKGHTFTNDRLDLSQFTNLEYTYISDVYQSGVTLVFPQHLKYISLNPKCTLIKQGSKLPSSLITFEGFWFTSGGNISIPSDFFSETNLESLYLWRAANQVQLPNNTGMANKLLGSFDFSHMSNLKEFCFGYNTVITSITLPSGKTDWEIFILQSLNNTITTNSFNSTIEDILDSSSLKVFVIRDCSFSKSRNILDVDISNSLVYFWLQGNSWVGDFSITSSKTSLKEIKLGNNQNETNTFQNIDISGLDGGSVSLLHFQGVGCENLTLPTSMPSLTEIVLYDNKLDINTNPDLISKINGYTSLGICQIGNGSTSVQELSHFGQTSINGLGSDPILSGLTNTYRLYLNKCGISGTLTLANTARLSELNVSFNTGLTAFANLNAHSTTLTQIFTVGCTNLQFEITSGFTAILHMYVMSSKITTIDVSGKLSTGSGTIVARSCPDLTLVKFSSDPTKAVILGNGGERFVLENSPNLSNIVNLENVSYSTITASATNYFWAYGCSLNMTFPLGTINFLPNNINISNNNITTLNVDATIGNIYNNRTKWNTYNTKVLNIGGTNRHVTGLYQAPSGFTLDVSDGTPVNAAEQLYVLTNNYDWTFTFNAEVIAGIHWSSVSGSYNALWSAVAYGNDTFVAVAKSGGGNRVMYSIDSGNTWTMTSSATNYWMWVTYGNGLFVAVGADGSNRVMTSPDGMNWTSRTSAGEFNQWNSVTYGGGLFVAVSRTGFGNRVMTSPDGINWTSRTSAADNNWNSVTYGNGLFVAVSDNGSGNRVMTSPDGINWTSRTSAADNAWQGVTYGNGLFVAVSNTGTGNRVMTSPDGINWTSRSTPVDNSWKSVAYGNDMFVAVSNTGTATNRVMTSVDGITWVSRTSAGSTNNEWQGITYGDGQFIAVSHASSNWIMKSP